MNCNGSETPPVCWPILLHGVMDDINRVQRPYGDPVIRDPDSLESCERGLLILSQEPKKCANGHNCQRNVSKQAHFSSLFPEISVDDPSGFEIGADGGVESLFKP